MRRREFITLLARAPAWPLAAGAHRRRMRRVGVMMGLPEHPEVQPRLAA